MKQFKELYEQWVSETEEETRRFRMKRNPFFKKLKQICKESDENKANIISGFLVREISDEELRCEQSMLLLRVLAGRNVVPKYYRNDINVAWEFWLHWYEDLILKESFY